VAQYKILNELNKPQALQQSALSWLCPAGI
jgi:hypothetical protein